MKHRILYTIIGLLFAVNVFQYLKYSAVKIQIKEIIVQHDSIMVLVGKANEQIRNIIKEKKHGNNND